MATLKATVREGRGKGAARKLRSSGQVPAVAYGHGMDAQSLAINTHELEVLLATINPENTIIDLKVAGGRSTPALIREVHRHPSRPIILHVDFFQVHAGETLHVSVPIRVHGVPIGVREDGGVLQEVIRELSVECLPKDIPSAIDLDISELRVGGSIHVADVSLPRVTILNDPDLVICSVTTPSTAALPEDEAADGEPEVLSSRKGEGDSEEGSDQGK